MDEKILSRIQKLLALAGSDPESPEAVAAATKAADLMVKHNIGYEDVKADGTVEDGNMSNEAVSANAAHHQIWESKLSRLLCDVFECKSILDGSRRNENRRRVFIGTKSDVTILVWFFKYLRLRIAKQSEKKFRLHVDQKEFGIGCIDALTPRMNEMYKRKKEAEKVSCTDIMIVGKSLAVNKRVTELYPKIKKIGYAHSGGSREARTAGIVHGQTMSINQQVR